MAGLFETFSILKSGLKQLSGETSGIGVGLSTSKSLVEALGGQIHVSSGKDGTKVNFWVAATCRANMGSFEKDLNESRNLICAQSFTTIDDSYSGDSENSREIRISGMREASETAN